MALWHDGYVKSKDIVREKATQFAVECFRFIRESGISSSHPDLAKQLRRSGSAPGALISEAREAESRKDFRHKLKVALKEARETEYWLRVVADAELSTSPSLEGLRSLNSEVIALLVAILRTMRDNDERSL